MESYAAGAHQHGERGHERRCEKPCVDPDRAPAQIPSATPLTSNPTAVL
jgi:hypothetical protein